MGEFQPYRSLWVDRVVLGSGMRMKNGLDWISAKGHDSITWLFVHCFHFDLKFRLLVYKVSKLPNCHHYFIKLASSLSFNPSTPKSDQHQISFYYSTAELNKLRS